MLWIRQLFIFIFAAGVQAIPLLLSWTSSVKLLNADSDPSNITDLTATTGVIALDYHYYRGEFYFSDASGTIRRGWLRIPNLNSKPVVIAEVKLCDGLAVDWVHNNLYWTDITRQTLETSNLDGLHRRILFNTSQGLEKPRAVVLDPYQGLIFWSDWGSNAQVASSGLDGKMKTIITTDVVWPNGLTLDLEDNKLYIMDGMRSTISSCNYDGSSLTVVFKSEEMVKQAFGLTYYANKVYWDSWRTHAVYSLVIDSEKTQTVLKRTGWRVISERMMGMKAVHFSLQKPNRYPDPCEKAGCSHQCLLGHGSSASCVCPYGFNLHSDNKTCIEEGYIMITWRGTIRRYTLHGDFEEPMYDSSKAAIALDYHYNKSLVFWSDIDENRIYRAPLDQLNNKTVVAVTETCDGLAVDWVHDVLYWTDTEHNTLEASHLDGSDHKVIISNDLDQPRAIALDPHSGFIFWSDWGRNAKIERTALDGSERTAILTENLFWPNGITLDLDKKQIYWVDGHYSSIYSSSYDGTRRETILDHTVVTLQPFAISMYQDFLYWTDWSTMALYKAKRSEMTSVTRLAKAVIILLRPNGVKVVHSSLQKQTSNPCSLMRCRGLCVGSQTPGKGHCLGELVEDVEVITRIPERSSDPEYVGIIKNVFNDSVQLSTNTSTSISLAVVSVKCMRRLGCSEDKRCSDFAKRTEVFVNKLKFVVRDLLPDTQYSFDFTSPEYSEKFTLNTLPTDPPETPQQLVVEVKGTSVTVKWNPVDECIPGFLHYSYKLFRGKVDNDGGANSEPIEGHTNKTELTFENLRPKTIYTVQVYTYDQNHFSSVEFETNEPEEMDSFLENVIVYKKSRSSVFFRSIPKNDSRKDIEYLLGKYAHPDSNEVTSFERKAVPCIMWPESFCFNVSSLEYNKTYNFNVSATLKNGTVGQEKLVFALTKEEVPGPPEELHVASYGPTSVELHWKHPNQSNGIVRSFLVNIDEIDTTDKDKCCQSFPIIELPVKTEEPLFLIEAGGLLPASTYAMSVTVKTLYVGGSQSIDVHTPPAPMDILHQPNISVPQQSDIKWRPRENPPTDQPQYPQLIRSYILLLVPQNSNKGKESTISGLGPLLPLLQTKFGKDAVVLFNKSKEAVASSHQPLQVNDLVSGQNYRLVWLQVSEYKGSYGLDYVETEIFTAT